MENRVLKVFYGTDLLPYKDVERTVHYPVGGSTFAGTNNTYEVHFYVDKIGGTGDISWVVVSKLPNGKLGYQPIADVEIDSDLNENYLVFDLSSYYSQYKGVVKLALRGYQGNITFTEVDSDIYEITGDPLIEVTGTIDLAINYSPFVNTSATLLPTEVDRILAALSQYLKIGNGIVALPNSSADISDYGVGQVFLNLQTGRFVYKHNASVTTLSQAYQYEFNSLMTQELDITEGSGEIWGTIEKGPQDNIKITTMAGGEYIISENGIYDNANGTWFATEDWVEGYTMLKKSYYATQTIQSIYQEVGTQPILLKNLTSGYWYYFHIYDHYNVGGNVYNSVRMISIDGAAQRFLTTLGGTTATIQDVLNATNDPYAKSGDLNYKVDGFVLDLTGEQGTSGTLDQQDYYRLVNDDTAFIIYNEHLYVRNRSDGAEAMFYCLSIGDDFVLYNEEIYIDATYHWYYADYSNGTILATQDWLANEYYDKNDIDSMLSSTYNYIGTKTVAEINALNTSNLHVGDVYNVSDSGTITLGSVAVVAGDNIAWTGSAWDKLAGTIDTSVFVQKTNSANKVYGTNELGAQTTYTVDDFYDGNIARRDSDGSITVPLTPSSNGHASSKKYVDDSISGVKADNYQFVNITTYPTLADFLATTGVQGTMYLYPIDTSDYTKGYYKYIYEIGWNNLGTTIVDLSGYPQKSANENITGTWSFSNTTNINGITPIFSSSFDLGASAAKWKDLYLSGKIYIDSGTFEYSSGFTFSNLLKPSSNNSYDLGTSSYAWKDLYLSGTAYLTKLESATSFLFRINGNDRYYFDDNAIYPNNNNLKNLGRSGNKWKDLYLAGLIYGATYNESLDEIYTTINNLNDTGSTEIKWSQMLTFSLSADTTLTFETAKTNCLNEYKAIITNSGASAITLTFTGISNILCNDDNCVISNGTNSTLQVPSGITIEVNAVNGKLIAVNFEAQ